MTQPGIEPRSPMPLANTLPTEPHITVKKDVGFLFFLLLVTIGRLVLFCYFYSIDYMQTIIFSIIHYNFSMVHSASYLKRYIMHVIILYTVICTHSHTHSHTHTHIYIYIVFANGLGDLGSITGRVIPKTFKMVLDISLLNTQQYNGKVEQSR